MVENPTKLTNRAQEHPLDNPIAFQLSSIDLSVCNTLLIN